MAELLSPQLLSDTRVRVRMDRAARMRFSLERQGTATQCLTGVDWPRLLLLAREHGVDGQLVACLNDLDAPAIPSELKQALLERQREQSFLTLRLPGELFRLLELFNRNEIRALVIKGPVLAVQAYADPGIRSYGDLDLLARQRGIRRATEVMIAYDYQAVVSLDALQAGKIPGQYLFYKADSQLVAELHNDSTLRYFPRPLPQTPSPARRCKNTRTKTTR